MIPIAMWIVFAAGLVAQEPDWMAAGEAALDKGSPEEAAADYAHALNTRVLHGDRPLDLLDLRVTLASAYMEAGDYHSMEVVLLEAQKSAGELGDGVLRAELLNAWSALHSKQGRLPAAEAELRESYRIVSKLPDTGSLLPTVLHNLAALDMRSGQYDNALAHEQEAIHRFQTFLAPDHPALIRAWASMASLQYVMNRPADAKSSMDTALASAEKTYGPKHPLLGHLLLSDAVILEKLKQKKQARLARERARKIVGKDAMDEPDPMTWDVRQALAPDRQSHLSSK